MFSLENNTFKFVFEDEISDEGHRIYTLDVWQDGNWIAHTSFEPHEAWGLANYLTNGILDSIVAEVEGVSCDTQVWDGTNLVTCGDGAYCPSCEYVIEERDKNVRGE
jgi:hypothetical protein